MTGDAPGAIWHMKSEYKDDHLILATAADAPSGPPRGGPPVAVQPEGTVKLWDVATGAQRAALPVSGGSLPLLAFAPDSRTLAEQILSAARRAVDDASGKTAEIVNAVMPADLSLERLGAGVTATFGVHDADLDRKAGPHGQG